MISKFMDIQIDILGVEFDFQVEYVITSYGSSDSYMEPGDPPELYIDQVINKRTGEDMTDWLDKNHDWLSKDYKPWLSLVNHRAPKDAVIDRIRSMMFDPFGQRFIRKLEWNALTWLNVLEDIVYQREEFDESDDRVGYD